MRWESIATNQKAVAARDSGKGIVSAIVETLYQPLRPVTSGSGRAFSQTGLGLAMCRKPVDVVGRN